MKRTKRGWKTEERARNPLSKELSQPPSVPRCSFARVCRKLSRVPRASYFRIRHRFTPPSPCLYVPPQSPSTFPVALVGYLRGVWIPHLSRRRPSSSPFILVPRRRNESFGSDRCRNLAGIDNHGDGAVLVGFSPPKLAASFARKHP